MFAGTSLPQLLFGLAAEIAGQTQTEVPSAESFLSSRRGPISALESCLSRIDVPTLIAFDEVDYLKHIDEMNTFFRFVRAFYGSQFAEQQERPVTLLVSSFLSPREFIDDSFSSPFNIGQQFRVENFKHSQADELLRICGIEVTPKESQSLFSLTGGQPYLTHLIAWLLQGSMSIDEILRNADSIDGPFGMHLEMVASYVAHSRKAKRALEDVARGRKANAYDLVELVDRGILKVESAGAVFTSELYKRYFASNI
jgi:hypothetical protein